MAAPHRADLRRLAAIAAITALLAAAGCAHRGWDQPPREGWKVVTSDHFVVRTDGAAHEYQPVIDRLEDMYEALSASFFAGMPVAPIDVLLFSRERDFKAIAPKNLVGFFTSKIARLEGGLLVFSSDGEDFELVANTAAHELAHRFLVEVSERVPTWLHEGFAKYVGASQVRGDLVVFDAAATKPHQVVADPLPLARVLSSSGNDFHGADARAQYLTAWMLMRQLLGNPGPGSISRFQKLVARSAVESSSVAQAAAVSEAFEGAAMVDIERAIAVSHRGLVRGVRRPAGQASVAVKIKRQGRSPLQVAPADRLEIFRLRAELRDHQGD